MRPLAAILLGIALLLASPLRAATGEVQAFVQSIGDSAVRLLGPGIADAAARRATVDRLLHEQFDLDGIARLSLGRFWRVASDAQRAEFLALFAAFMTNLYANSLDRDPADPPVVTGFAVDRVREEEGGSAGARDFSVTSHFQRPAGPAVRVEWRVRANEGGYRVTDVSVEGLRMVVLFRQMLATALQAGGGDVEGLLARLRDMTGRGAAQPVPATETDGGGT